MPNLGRWEWAIGEALVLVFLVYELFSIRRTIRGDRQRAEVPPKLTER